jgi:hypothetical protein
MSQPGTVVAPARRNRRRLVASAALTGGFLIAGLVFAGSASAHVKVSGVDAVQGGSGVITFRVPFESDTASTTGLLITFPAATPFTSVDVQPKAGWTAKVTKKPLPHPLTDDDGARSPTTSRRSTSPPPVRVRARGSRPASSTCSTCRSGRSPRRRT